MSKSYYQAAQENIEKNSKRDKVIKQLKEDFKKASNDFYCRPFNYTSQDSALEGPRMVFNLWEESIKRLNEVE